MLLCPILAAALHGDAPMASMPEGYDSGTCHYDGRLARGYTLTTTRDPRPDIRARYGDAADVTSGDDTVVTWSDLGGPPRLAKDGIRMIVLVLRNGSAHVHVSATATTDEQRR